MLVVPLGKEVESWGSSVSGERGFSLELFSFQK